MFWFYGKVWGLARGFKNANPKEGSMKNRAPLRGGLRLPACADPQLRCTSCDLQNPDASLRVVKS